MDHHTRTVPITSSDLKMLQRVLDDWCAAHACTSEDARGQEKAKALIALFQDGLTTEDELREKTYTQLKSKALN